MKQILPIENVTEGGFRDRQGWGFGVGTWEVDIAAGLLV